MNTLFLDLGAFPGTGSRFGPGVVCLCWGGRDFGGDVWPRPGLLSPLLLALASGYFTAIRSLAVAIVSIQLNEMNVEAFGLTERDREVSPSTVVHHFWFVPV